MLRLIATPTSGKVRCIVVLRLTVSLKWLLLLAIHHALKCLMMAQMSLNQMFLVL